MKKITIKLSFDEMDCFFNVCRELGNDQRCTDLVRAVLFELYFRSQHRTQFYFAKHRSLQLRMSEAIAICAALGAVTFDNFSPYALAVITPIYQTIQKQLQ